MTVSGVVRNSQARGPAPPRPRVRESVDVIIPFNGTPWQFAELVARMRRLQLGPDDSLTVVDNSRRGARSASMDQWPIRIVTAPERQSSYYARNRGVSVGSGSWLLFLDADVDPIPDLIDRYLAARPKEGSGFLVGSVQDIRSAEGEKESITSRYSRLRRLIDQTNTLQMRRPYAKTANCAVRRAAFEEVRGFANAVRSGGDADLCLRLQEAGWGFELRPGAVVRHCSRGSLGGLLEQRSRHGAGAEWLESRYPGFIGSRQGPVALGRHIVGGAARSVLSYVRRDIDAAVVELLDPISNAAFEVGRRLPNAAWREHPALVLAGVRRWMVARRVALGVRK